MPSAQRWLVLSFLAACFAGCCHPSISAVPLSPWNCNEPEGIPFYLPKPLLIVSKNFRYIEEAKVGLTNGAPIPHGFDDQSKYGDVNSRANFEGSTQTASTEIATNQGSATASPQVLHSDKIPLAPDQAPSDGLKPETFYTYQIIFVPDLSQKYGLKIKGGVGEIRAAMNLVNGWQFTGLGPYYMKDSSTAQNILATGIAANLTGRGIGDVAKNVADLAKALPRKQRGEIEAEALAELYKNLKSIQETAGPPIKAHLADFAEMYVYEPVLEDNGTTHWRLIEMVKHSFRRDYLQGPTTRTLQFKDAQPEKQSGEPAKADSKTPPLGPAKPHGGSVSPGSDKDASLEQQKGQLPSDAEFDRLQSDAARAAIERAMALPPGSLAGGMGRQRGELDSAGMPTSFRTCPEIKPHGPVSRFLKRCFCRPQFKETVVVSGAVPAPDVDGPAIRPPAVIRPAVEDIKKAVTDLGFPETPPANP